MREAFRVRALEALGEDELRGLCDVLVDCVEGGASVSFMLPMTSAKAEVFWREAGESLARGERVVLAACDEAGAIVGTVQVVFAPYENQPHRADVSKMLVHRRARNRGVGAALLAAAEEHARRAGRTLLVLDTANPQAERLYARGGWQRVGVIPDFALMPDGPTCDTTLFYKALAAVS